MPIYVWICDKCEHEIESIMKISEMEEWEAIDVVCEVKRCGGVYKRDISHGTNFELKGRGWADDGYVQGLKDYDPQGGEY